jgi:hypothetical protein
MARICKIGGGPEPFKGIAIEPSLQVPGPGEVLIRYEVELVGWQVYIGAGLCGSYGKHCKNCTCRAPSF